MTALLLTFSQSALRGGIVFHCLEEVPRGSQLLTAWSSLCGPTHPKTSQLSLDHGYSGDKVI